MLDMFLYGIAIMYSPGPVNLLGLNMGLKQKLIMSTMYCIGVGSAMLFWFLVFGYSGEKIVKKEYLIYISIVGGLYILYLAYKILKSNVTVSQTDSKSNLKYKDGFLMQVMNPKGIIATLPIATYHYIINDITGINIFFTSLILATLAGLAPFSYAIFGSFMGKFFKDNRFLNIFNKVMGLLLIYVAFTILYDHVFLVLIGVNPY